MSHKKHHHIHAPQTQTNAAAEPAPQSRNADSCNVESNVERIRIRAFEISQARNGGPGDERTDWLQAEQDLQTQVENSA